MRTAPESPLHRSGEIDAAVAPIRPWYAEWFDREEYELVYRHRDDRDAAGLIGLIERVAAPSPGAAVLDVACGRGRHARLLARRGYRVTGADLSARAIERARRAAAAEGLDIRFLQADMREPVGTACFDLVVNLFTAFGYFEHQSEHDRAIAAMATALRPGGSLVQDFLNADYVRAHLVPVDERREGEVTILQERWIERGRINKRITLRRGAESAGFHESVRLFTAADFEAMYRRAGLDLVACYGDYDGRPADSLAPRLILHALRRA